MLTTEFSLDAAADQRLEALVDGIEARPGAFVDVPEMRELQDRLQMRGALQTLPPGLSEDDFVGILKLALLTESATDTYAEAIDERARRYGAGWLGRFNRNVWAPDELTHHAPFHHMLLGLGVSEEELEREIREAQDRDLNHRSGDTPIHLTTYGMVQEYLTDNWHGLIANLTRDAAPEAAQMANAVKRRETLHTIWYRDMTALQVEANPALLRHVAEALGAFQMPGNAIVPQLEPHVPRWLPAMGADFDQMTRDLVRHLHAIAGDTRRAGALLLEIAEERGLRMGPVPPRHIHAALNRLGGPGYGLLGEAMLERAGLSYLFTPRAEPGAAGATARAVERLRALLRSWIARRLDIRIDPQPAQ